MVSTMRDMFPEVPNHPDDQDSGPESDGDSEIKVYLEKLKEIVPRCPKHRRVTRLELIQHVIDYICDLQQALEDRRDAGLSPFSHQQYIPGEAYKNQGIPRQPLGVLPLPENLPVPTLRRDASRYSSYGRQPKTVDTSSVYSPGGRTENG